MKCKFCNSEWSTVTGLGASVTECPFCHASLIDDKPQELTTITSVIAAIISSSGIQTLSDGAKTLSLFSDFAPQLAKERRLVKLLYESNEIGILLSAINDCDNDFDRVYNSVINCLETDYYISTTAANLLCSSFVAAIDPDRALPQKEIIDNGEPISQKSDFSETRDTSSIPDEKLGQLLSSKQKQPAETCRCRSAL